MRNPVGLFYLWWQRFIMRQAQSIIITNRRYSTICMEVDGMKRVLFKVIVPAVIIVSEINNVELEEMINCILEKGIEEHGFYAWCR